MHTRRMPFEDKKAQMGVMLLYAKECQRFASDTKYFIK